MNKVSPILQNIALLLGAIITVLNAVEAFYDHRSLWVRRTVTLARLYELKRKLNLFAIGSGQQNEIEFKTLSRFIDCYDRILADDLKAWLKLREDSSPKLDPPLMKESTD